MSLQKLTELILPERRAPRVCEACGESFACGASLKGCWCSAIKLDAAARQALRERYRDCLCPTCLENYSSSPASEKPDER